MKVLVDTCVWSHVLRHKDPDIELTNKLKGLILDNLVVTIGPIRQELLSGISQHSQFEALKGHLSFFEDIPLVSEYFVKAAEFSNICRKKGIQGSSTDFLICAAAFLNNISVFTIDSDFENYKHHLPIHLFEK